MRLVTAVSEMRVHVSHAREKRGQTKVWEDVREVEQLLQERKSQAMKDERGKMSKDDKRSLDLRRDETRGGSRS